MLTPALLCYKDTAQGTQSPLLGTFLAWYGMDAEVWILHFIMFHQLSQYSPFQAPQLLFSSRCTVVQQLGLPGSTIWPGTRSLLRFYRNIWGRESISLNRRMSLREKSRSWSFMKNSETEAMILSNSLSFYWNSNVNNRIIIFCSI